MNFSFKCIHCGSLIQADESWAGMKVKCPLCSQILVVPASTNEDVTIPPAPRSPSNPPAPPTPPAPPAPPAPPTPPAPPIQQAPEEVPTTLPEPPAPLAPQASAAPSAPAEPPAQPAPPIQPAPAQPAPPIQPAPQAPQPQTPPTFAQVEVNPSAAAPVSLGMATGALFLGILSFLCVPLCGLIALILGIVALIKIKNSNGHYKGKGKAVTGIIFGVWSIIRLPILGILAALLLPALSKAREKATSISCCNNLKQVGLAMTMFTCDHDDCFPNASGQSMEEVKTNVGSPEAFKCPAGDEYLILVNGQRSSTLRDPANTIIAVCSNEHGTGLMNVLFADGHVASVDADVVRRALEDMSGGRLPVLK